MGEGMSLHRPAVAVGPEFLRSTFLSIKNLAKDIYLGSLQGEVGCTSTLTIPVTLSRFQFAPRCFQLPFKPFNEAVESCQHRRDLPLVSGGDAGDVPRDIPGIVTGDGLLGLEPLKRDANTGATIIATLLGPFSPDHKP